METESIVTPNSLLHRVEELTKCLILDEDTLLRIRDVFREEMNLGLAANPPKKSSLQMANTYIPELPNGTEEGEYLALDLGGTNFRILYLKYNQGKVTEELVKYFNVDESLRLGPGEDLFDFLAASIHIFMSENNLNGCKLPLGFTFSFPMEQKSLDSAFLVNWTKSFNCPGVIGEEVVELLKKSITKRGDLDVEIVAILNDTTGTLLQGALLYKNCGIGLILGTGSNACYIEKIENVEKWEGKKPDNAKEVIIDIEWGAFGDNGELDFIRTSYDKKVDETSLLPNSFTFEKYFSGRYLGEIVRVILVELASQNILFKGKASPILLTHDSFTTAFVSSIEDDSMKVSSDKIEKILKELEQEYDENDIEILKYVCFLVSDRAAKLISICLAAILQKMDRKDEVVIAVDGSLFQFHPRLELLMLRYIEKYAPLNKFKLKLAEDGSGKGAGLATAIAKRLKM